MLRLSSTVVLLAAVGMLSHFAAAADPQSGPAPGSDLAALKVIVAVGDQEGKEVDLAAERAKAQTWYCFVRADRWDRPVGRFVAALDARLRELPGEPRIVAVWLAEDVDAAREYLPRAQTSLKLERTIWTVHPGDVSGPEGWGINSDMHLTVVAAEEGKAAASFPFISVNETDVPAVLAALKKSE